MHSIRLPQPPEHAAPRWRALPVFMLVISMLVLIAAWTVLALVFERELSGFALVMAVLLASSLRFWKAPEDSWRPWVAASATAACIVLARWWIAAGFLGQSLGLYPQESIQRMGLWFVTYLNGKALGLADYCLFASGILLAAFMARPRA